MNDKPLFWATAYAGVRVLTAVGYILFVAFIGRLLGALDAHPLLSAGLILPILALTIFDNLWISGVLHQPGTVRAGALAGLAVVAALGFAYGGAAIPTVPFALVLGFLAIMAVTALLRPDVRG